MKRLSKNTGIAKTIPEKLDIDPLPRFLLVACDAP